MIPKVFRITHVLNTGAAFSMFDSAKSPTLVRNLLITFTVVAVAGLLIMLWRAGRTATLATVAFALILGGALGNLYDRVRFSLRCRLS